MAFRTNRLQRKHHSPIPRPQRQTHSRIPASRLGRHRARGSQNALARFARITLADAVSIPRRVQQDRPRQPHCEIGEPRRFLPTHDPQTRRRNPGRTQAIKLSHRTRAHAQGRRKPEANQAPGQMTPSCARCRGIKPPAANARALRRRIRKIADAGDLASIGIPGEIARRCKTDARAIRQFPPNPLRRIPMK